MRITDAQIHLWANGQAPPHHWRAPYSIGDALRDMDDAGIDSAVNHPPSWDSGSNDYAVQAANAHPERFATLGWFPLDEFSDESLVDRWLAKPGMLGLRFVMATPQAGSQLASGGLDWLWSAADRHEAAMGLFVMPQQLPAVGGIAARYPRMRLLVDHMAVSPFLKLPGAAADFDMLLDLARHSNIAIKATAVPSMATDEYPFASTHDLLRRVFDSYGAKRMFWGSDITRLRCSWRECLRLFTEELPWLKGSDLEWVMGRGVREWIGWR